MKNNVRVQPENENEKNACIDIVNIAIKENIKTAQDLFVLKKNACEKYKIGFVSNPLLLNTYRLLVDDDEIKENNVLFQLLRKRRVRTSSGIASVAVLTKPYKCPGKCLFCPTQTDVPKSYIDNEPAVMRAILAGYDPVKQVNIRLRGLEISGNPANKIELIVMGGTFSYLPKIYQLKFIIGCFAACNRYKMQNEKLKTKNNSSKFETNSKFQIKNLPNSIKKLKEMLAIEQTKNERAKYRIIGLTLETRPDYISEDELKWFRLLGCTRVEIGVQSIDDRILNINNRGHNKKQTIEATKLLKDAGFKINYHMMPNLYGSNVKKDFNMFKKLFSDQDYKPDMLKIYPCVVTKYSPYLKLYNDKKYIPYTDDELIDLIIRIKKNIPNYVRIQRLIRDIPAQNIVGSSTISNLRQLINERHPNICKCIRCREIRNLKKEKVYFRRFDYDGSNGKEIFLEYIDKNNKLYAMLRLRITSCADNHWIKELRNSSIIRELHTYGPMVEFGINTKKDPQHSGLGKRLIDRAEKITNDEFGLKKIAVISGVGVRGYYKKFGYQINDLYMIKKL